ncbi:hypothetical protein CspeluHIS016_0300960 [Cutaneotrichosporon spelunceum]|uniref:Cell division control protein 14 n=1 Tax=Cutaneotrichosporon spelunceum TaxID=1672016 RepID=A0AAD3YAR6_9TREE|nr:hypothetical protein CspeluHIS016_0300960 [Cutaneotrichosporon spelunceum]
MDTPGGPGARRERREHRKSHSSSALSLIADPPPRSRQASLAPVDPLRSVDDLIPVLDVLRSLRSSGRRRAHALRQLEATLMLAYAGQGVPIADLLELKFHEPVLALMGRHTASLIKRGSGTALLPNDDLAQHLKPELDVAVNILQGLCLLSKSCKATAGRMWTMEMFIDLIMLLRNQVSLEGKKTTVYLLLDLLFCILVDAPNNARMFEDLNGLEAVSRVLRGGSVERDVKIKAMEFLHFYLQPEEGGESAQPPRSALAVGTDIGRYQTPEPQSFVAEERAPPSRSGSTTPHDSDLPFIPQTPRKPAKQTLGFQTPSARRFERETPANSSGTSLAPVPSSPRSDDESDGSLTKRGSAAWQDAQRRMDARADRVSSASSDLSQASNVSSSGSSSSSSTVVQRAGHIAANTRPHHRSSLSTSAVPSPAISRRSSRAPSSRDKSASSSLLSKPKATTQHSLDTDPALLVRRVSRRSQPKSPLAESTTPEEVARRPRHSRVHSAAPLSTPNQQHSSSSSRSAVQRSKGFPSELTKGRLPDALPAALAPSRRVPSGVVGEDGQRVRAVSDKKLMLAEYVANVDQLVEGAEKMGLSSYKPY